MYDFTCRNGGEMIIEKNIDYTKLGRHSKVQILVKCDVCGREYKTTACTIHKSKHQVCCSKCLGKLSFLKSLAVAQNKLNCDLKSFLEQKYLHEGLGLLPISKLIYGHTQNHRTVKRLLDYFEIPIRCCSEAVKLQWVNNDERRKKQSEFAKIKFNSKEVRDKMIKTMRSDEVRKHFSEMRMGEKNPMYGVVGEKHFNFNPNISDEERKIKRKNIENARFRRFVLNRDNYTCQCCGDGKGGNLNVHHIFNHHSHKELRYDVNNGITLCKECHVNFHNKYGYKNNNQEQLKEFLLKGGN